MQALTERQETILALIVHEHIESARPVGSKKLVKRYKLGISSATVRNEMVVLSESGVLRQPHTSAGRVPTEEGYRYFVRRLLGETELSTDEKRMISHQFHQAPAEVNEWVRLSASILAQLSHVASVVTAPHPERAIFKHLELINTSGRQVLLVLILEGGDVRQQMLTLRVVIDQTQLTAMADRVTTACYGMNAESIANQATKFSDMENDAIRLIAEIMARTDAISSGDIHRDGLTNVLNQPEFASSDRARSALRLLEERGFLEEVLAKALSPRVGGIQVVIGGEGAWEELKECSMVLARYGAQGYATGAMGVLGPIRMSYGRTISAVRYVAGLMSDLVIESFGN
jgi:heat-inducible transcriptional repressor